MAQSISTNDGENHRPSQQDKQDHSIMGTNKSSIVSKRSVERVYYEEPHFFRYFVQKPHRRSPLINRGYWLRMHAVNYVVRQFLEESSKKAKIVLNLGCGYDPLPFQWLSKDRGLCRNTTFVDVDYPQLIAKKVNLIRSTPQIRDMLGSLNEESCENNVYLRSAHYHAVGCDLNSTTRLESILSGQIDMSKCMILCTAEVSVTYMKVEAADALIKWAARYNDIRFCLLEQFLPQGAGHPFATQMIQHFEKLQTPLKAIMKYPKLKDQGRRFMRYGWSSVDAKSLWDIWCDPEIVSPVQRKTLDGAEPFDEWEEFILFASHYFLLIACTSSSMVSKGGAACLIDDAGDGVPNSTLKGVLYSGIRPCDLPPGLHIQRFGSAFYSQGVVGIHGGLGRQGRSNTTDLFSVSTPSSLKATAGCAIVSDDSGLILPLAIESRMCHAIVTSRLGTCLLIGGRVSPDRPLMDCWYFNGKWRQVQDLPVPLYRQCATWIESAPGISTPLAVLVFGGKTISNEVSGRWLLWRDSIGWSTIECKGDPIPPTFGATMASIDMNSGVLIGGMTADSILQPNVWKWTISESETGQPLIFTAKFEFPGSDALQTFTRMGAHFVRSHLGLFLVGGVGNGPLGEEIDIVRLEPPRSSVGGWSVFSVICRNQALRTLLVGHSVLPFEESLLIIGGGAVCFSFGCIWNDPLIPLDLGSRKGPPKLQILGKMTTSLLEPRMSTGEADLYVQKTPTIKRLIACEVCSKILNPKQTENAASTSSNGMPITDSDVPSLNKIILRQTIADASRFIQILEDGKPTIIGGLKLSTCVDQWTLETLKCKIGAERQIIVHEANDRQMDFLQKNFVYRQKSVATFFADISQGAQQYLRSLSEEKPSDKAAHLESDFPELAADFSLPAELEFVKENQHSSVLRISGPVNMWLHYDVMANVLCQIIGSKRLLLYPPSEVSYFNIPPGSSSSSFNVFNEDAHRKNPGRASAHAYEAILHPGDVLYIPPLWLHAAAPLDTVNVSINVFFRNMQSGYAPGRDIYANRDLQAYEKARRDIQTLVKSFERLPHDMARFYLQRLADELKEKADLYGP